MKYNVNANEFCPDGYEAGQEAIIGTFEGMLNVIKAENLKEVEK